MSAAQHLVLILADAPARATALSALARAEGAAVLTAEDGREGLKIATNHQVDLVVASAHLPGMDGLQLLAELRGAQPGRYVPLMIVLSQEDKELRLAALRAGADDVISAPWDDDEVKSRLARTLLQRQRLDDLLDEGARLQKLAMTDTLTTVYNYRFFLDRLRDEFRRAQRYDDPLGVILIDLDHFKPFNETHGRALGDKVLQALSGVLRKVVRETDVVSRYGGEEFGMLLPKTHLAGSLTVAERVWKDIAALRFGEDQALQITASVGVSGFPARGVISADRLLHTADEALYRAKREGRNRICLYQHVSFFPDSTAPVE